MQILYRHACFCPKKACCIITKPWQALQALCPQQARLVTRECPSLEPNGLRDGALGHRAFNSDDLSGRFGRLAVLSHKASSAGLLVLRAAYTKRRASETKQQQITRMFASQTNVLPRPNVHKAASVTDAKASNPGKHVCGKKQAWAEISI